MPRRGPLETPSQIRKRLLHAVEDLARDQHGVVSRKQLRRVGVTRDHVRTHVNAGRWRTHGLQTVAVHTGELDERARWWSAVFEVGADAALDGVTSMRAAGLEGFREMPTHVSTSQGTNPPDPPGVCVHETRRRRDGDLVGAGIPRTRPEIATIRAALWAASDRQAALLVIMAVQQRLTTGRKLQQALARVRRHPRRRFLVAVVLDVTDGVQALGELDFGAWGGAYGLPRPNRQVLRRGRRGRVYLDVYWDRLGVVVEIEGVHHGAGETQVADALRQNALSIEKQLVLRVPVLGLRLAPDEFMAQVAEALAASRAA